LLAVHTPAPFEPNKPIRNGRIDEMTEKHCYEIVRWGAYYSDEQCMNMLRTNGDPNVVTYIALMHGITPIVTIGQFKSFVASFVKVEAKKNDRKLPKTLSTKELAKLEEKAKKRKK